MYDRVYVCGVCVAVFIKYFGTFYRKSRIFITNGYYHQISNISGAKFHNLNGSRLVLQLFLPNPSKPVV